MDGFMGAGVHAFGAVGAKRSPPAAKRVGAKPRCSDYIILAGAQGFNAGLKAGTAAGTREGSAAGAKAEQAFYK